MAIKNTNISFASANTFFRGNMGVIYLIMLVVLLIAEAFVINTTLQIVFHSPEAAVTETAASRGVQINFTNYDLAVKKIEGSQVFLPDDEPNINPFRTVERVVAP